MDKKIREIIQALEEIELLSRELEQGSSDKVYSKLSKITNIAAGVILDLKRKFNIR